MGVCGKGRLRGLVALAAVLTGATAVHAGEVVIRERPDGTVVITDAPGEGGEPAGGHTAGDAERAADAARRPAPDSDPAAEPSAPPAPDYAVELREPAPDAVIWADDARLPVSVSVEPSLVAGHRLRVRLGGHASATVDGAGVVELHPVHRGSYPLQAEVIDADGEVVAASPPRTIHVKQHSRLQPGTAD